MGIFTTNAKGRVKYTAFDKSHDKKLSLNMGKLVPVMLEEIVPGDKYSVQSEVMLRLAPMLAPMMHRVNCYMHYFFVPNRLVWNEWESFITGGRDGTEAPIAPRITLNNTHKDKFLHGSLADYLGVPTFATAPGTISQDLILSALPFRAYQLIYNEYYQDQNLTTPIDFSLNSGSITDPNEILRLTALRQRAWEKDYATSALPWTQRGDEVDIPITKDYLSQSIVKNASTGAPYGNASQLGSDALGGLDDNLSVSLRIENLDSAEFTINELRRSARIQEWLEKTARTGSRYVEQILSHFGVKSSDARLQRPEFLGGGRTPIVISEVLNTIAEATPSTYEPLGTMGGHGISVGATNKFARKFEEHGWILGIMSILPKTAYHQGIHKSFFRFDKFDYYWPEFAQLGEQEVKNQEIYYDPTGSKASLGVFGYQSRYAEYKYSNSSVHGDFRDATDYWHMGRKFTSPPDLNTSFVMSDPTHRIFAVTDPDVHKVYAQIYHKVKAVRPMPFFNIPQL